MLQEALAHAQSQRTRQLEELKQLLAIPSISTEPRAAEDVRRAAAWVAEHLRAIGCTRSEIWPTAGHPAVFGAWLGAGPQAPTVLVYGHYDVQPVDPLDEWRSPPFEPTVRDGVIYARGAADDKGQFFVHLKALEAYLRGAGRAPVNLKFLIEGEEEIGSDHLAACIGAHREDLAADVVVISDSHMIARDVPTILYSLRGLAYMEVEVRGPAQDLHSGAYGGAIHNPAQALCDIVAQLKDEQGRITIPGFYNRVRALDAEERALLAALPFDDARFRAEAGVAATWGESGYSVLEQISARPTLEVNGLISGYTGQGAKTVLPARALAKISMRLVPDQEPEEIAELFSAHVRRLAPPAVRVDVRLLHHGRPALLPRDIPQMRAAVRAYEQGFGRAPVFTREGGSIPVVSTFLETLGLPSILMGFGLPDDNLHSPNEKFELSNFYRGITTAIHFLDEVARVS
jgi:acetylornithine deacetylase/succinyl-diaminopimelate desuccinylase-like protein